MARKICIVVDHIETRDQRLKELDEFLLKQNYPRSLVNNGMKRAKDIPIVALRTTKEKTENKNIIPFNLNHNPHHTDIYIYNNARSNLPFMKDLITNKNQMRSRRQPPNCKKC